MASLPSNEPLKRWFKIDGIPSREVTRIMNALSWNGIESKNIKVTQTIFGTTILYYYTVELTHLTN